MPAGDLELRPRDPPRGGEELCRRRLEGDRVVAELVVDAGLEIDQYDPHITGPDAKEFGRRQRIGPQLPGVNAHLERMRRDCLEVEDGDRALGSHDAVDAEVEFHSKPVGRGQHVPHRLLHEERGLAGPGSLGVRPQAAVQARHRALEHRTVEARGNRLPARQAEEVGGASRTPRIDSPLPAREGGVDSDAKGAIEGGRDARGRECPGRP
jgi:hypothetical protein